MAVALVVAEALKKAAELAEKPKPKEKAAPVLAAALLVKKAA